MQWSDNMLISPAAPWDAAGLRRRTNYSFSPCREGAPGTLSNRFGMDRTIYMFDVDQRIVWVVDKMPNYFNHVFKIKRACGNDGEKAGAKPARSFC